MTGNDWSIRWDGNEWSASDLTGHHLAAVAEMLDIAPPWEWFDLSDLHPAYGPLQLMSVLAAFIIIEEGVRGAAARRAVLSSIEDATFDDILAALIVPVTA